MLQETFIILGMQLGFELTKRIQRHTDHDEYRGAPNIETHIECVFQVERSDAD